MQSGPCALDGAGSACSTSLDLIRFGAKIQGPELALSCQVDGWRGQGFAGDERQAYALDLRFASLLLVEAR
jgi:hypothetical protein